jgi:hypothetical protein
MPTTAPDDASATAVTAIPAAPLPDRVLLAQGGRVAAVNDVGEATAVTEHLGALLQVQNLVVLLGSGASFHLGSPRIRSLTTADVVTMVADTGRTLTPAEQALLSALNAHDDGDLEQLLDHLQVLAAYATKLNQDPARVGTVDVPRAAISGLRLALNLALAHACDLPGSSCPLPDPLEAHRTLLSRIARARRATLPRAKLFTTNYDLVIEKALDQLGYPYVDGFSGTVDRRLNLPFYGLDNHRVDTLSQQVIERTDTSFYVYKVHGSLNWRVDTAAAVHDGIDSVQVRQVHTVPGEGDDTALIYPTASKEGDTLAYPYSDLLRLLSGTLQQPDTAVLSLGYGFKDVHINRIVLGALTMNSGMHLTIADPVGVLDEEDLALALKGAPLSDAELTKTTPIWRLARQTDSRVAVITGPGGAFTELVKMLPDPGIRREAPNGLARLIEGLTLAEDSASADA